MASIYLGNWHLFKRRTGNIDLPSVDPKLSLDQSVGVWPIPDSISTDVPNSGDYVIFLSSSGDIYGIGRIGGVTTEESTIEYALQLVNQEEINESVGAVATIVQYQETDYGSRLGRPNLEDVFENIDSDDLGTALSTGYPPGRNWILQKIPDWIWSENQSPSVILRKIRGIDSAGFYSDPGGDGGPYRNQGPEDFDDDEGGLVVDRAGTLLEQGYASRDVIRDSSKASLQIAILLFGVIVASLSVFREEVETGLLNIQTPVVAGGLLIATGVILAAIVFIHTAVRPRPYADVVAEHQRTLNIELPGVESSEKQHFIAEFSEVYHDILNRVGIGNRILGGLVGAAVGLSLGGVFLSALSIVFQVGMGSSITGGAVIGISVLILLLTLYGAYFAFDGIGKFDRDWISEN